MQFDFKTTFPILKYPDLEELFYCDKQQEMEWQIAVRKAEVVGTLTELTDEQILRRYPRIVQAVCTMGYSEQAAASRIRSFRRFKSLNRQPIDEQMIKAAIDGLRRQRQYVRQVKKLHQQCGMSPS
jgi:hypothetical protein